MIFERKVSQTASISKINFQFSIIREKLILLVSTTFYIINPSHNLASIIENMITGKGRENMTSFIRGYKKLICPFTIPTRMKFP